MANTPTKSPRGVDPSDIFGDKGRKQVKAKQEEQAETEPAKPQSLADILAPENKGKRAQRQQEEMPRDEGSAFNAHTRRPKARAIPAKDRIR